MVLQVHVAYGSEVPPLSAALSPDADSTQTRSTPNSSTLRGAAPAGARTFVAAGVGGATSAFGGAPLSSWPLSRVISAVSASLCSNILART